MIGQSMKYLSWFTAACAAGLLTFRGFRWDHWADAWHSAQFPDEKVTPYLFGAAGLAIVLLFGLSVVRAIAAERRALKAALGANSWLQLIDQVGAVRNHGRCGLFCSWAERQLKLNPGACPDSQGWLGRQLAASQHASSIRTLANVLIVLGIAFTFEAIANSTKSLSAAIQQAAESPDGTSVSPTPRLAPDSADNVRNLVAQAERLRREIGRALDPLTVAFGANLNGILFTIDLLVLLAFLRLLEGDATRQLQHFVLDLADPLLQAAAVTADPTHKLLRELNGNQVQELQRLVQQLHDTFSANLAKAFEDNAKHAESIAENLSRIVGSSKEITEHATKTIEKTASRTAKSLTAEVTNEFTVGLVEFNRVVTDDLPRKFNTAAEDMAGAVRLAAVSAVYEANKASHDLLTDAGVVGDRLQAAALSLEQALSRTVASLAAHTESAAQHLADAGQQSGLALASACQGGASQVREAAQTTAELLREAGVQAHITVGRATATARSELAAEIALQGKLLSDEAQRLTDASAVMLGVTEHLAEFAGQQTDLTAQQAHLAEVLTRAAAGLERSGQATALATEPMLKSADRIALALDRDGRNLLALQQALARQPVQLTEVLTRLETVLTALASAERSLTASTDRAADSLQVVTDALRETTARNHVRSGGAAASIPTFQLPHVDLRPSGAVAADRSEGTLVAAGADDTVLERLA